jgi:thiol:disulfide interchange protein DsbA
MVIGLFCLAPLHGLQAASFEEGVNYHWVAPEQAGGDEIEVIEFFWYGCPHCFSFEPMIAEWLENKPEDVVFRKMPATFNRPEVQLHAKTFYALDVMGVPGQIHADIMAEMHNKKNRLSTQGEVEDFLASKGIDLDAFREALNSFAVYVKVQRAAQLAQRYGVTGVPALVVDGQYRNGDIKSYDEMIELLDFLIEQARTSRSAD